MSVQLATAPHDATDDLWDVLHQVVANQLAGQRPGGILYIDGAFDEARVCFHEGRIAWVHSGANGGFLSERLAQTLRMTDIELRATLEECRREGRRLGEHLVAQRMLSRWEFREVLAAHNRGHLNTLFEGVRGGGDLQFSFEAREEAYDAAFTFSLPSLLADDSEVVSRASAQNLLATMRKTQSGCSAWVLQWGTVCASSHGLEPPRMAHPLLAMWQQAVPDRGPAEVVANFDATSLVLLAAAPELALLIQCDLRRCARGLALARRLKPAFNALTPAVLE